jgi:hypothetical protein
MRSRSGHMPTRRRSGGPVASVVVSLVLTDTESSVRTMTVAERIVGGLLASIDRRRDGWHEQSAARAEPRGFVAEDHPRIMRHSIPGVAIITTMQAVSREANLVAADNGGGLAGL